MNSFENNLNENNSSDEELELMEEKTEKKENLLLSFEYDVKNEEEGQAFLLFQKKYVYKKNWIKTIAFAIVAILFIISITRTPEEPIYYVLTTISIAAIYIIWYNTKRIRTSLMDALKLIEDDRYIFTLYEDSFTIETILAEDVDENGEKIPPVAPRTVNFEDTVLDIFETDGMFVLVLKKDTIYVLPKRCIDSDKEDILRNKLSEKNADRFEKIS